MSTTTAKLKLRQPERGVGGASDDLINVDSDVNANMDTIDKKIHCEVVTSAARPADPFQGQFIFETDTKYVRMWKGTKWVVVGADKFAKGRIGISTSSADVSLPANTETGPIHSITFNAKSDRRYLVEWHFYLSAFPQINRLRFRWAAGASVTTTGAIIGNQQLCSTHNSSGGLDEHYNRFVTAPSGTFSDAQVTVGTFIEVGANPADMNFSASPALVRDFLIRDVGN